jgi:hypothetical protein
LHQFLNIESKKYLKILNGMKLANILVKKNKGGLFNNDSRFLTE